MKKRIIRYAMPAISGTVLITVVFACDLFPPEAGIKQLTHPYVCKQEEVTLNGSDPDYSHDNDEYDGEDVPHSVDAWC